MNDKSDIISTDRPLTTIQQDTLAALLDVIIPATDDGRMPSAAELNLAVYIGRQEPDFLPILGKELDALDAAAGEEPFAALIQTDRHQHAEELSKTQAVLFGNLLFHAYACYYQDDRVLEGIGLTPGPPFPRGHTIESGDLSLLDPVLQRPKMYRST